MEAHRLRLIVPLRGVPSVMFHVKPRGRPRGADERNMHMSSRIPPSWSYWCNGGASEGIAWFNARHLKEQRESLRPELFVRVKVVRGPGGSWWILHKEETRETETVT